MFTLFYIPKVQVESCVVVGGGQGWRWAWSMENGVLHLRHVGEQEH